MVGSYQRHFWRKSLGVLAALAWLGVTLGGLKWLLDYQSAPARAADPPAMWVASSRVVRAPGRATLLLFAHPHCPCTRATLSELERLMADVHGGVDCQVVFVLPGRQDSTWARTDQWRTASRIPGVRVFVDRGGVEAARFGAATSGQVLLYDLAGRLAFAGGITPGRGHAGDNAGRDAIVAKVLAGSGQGLALAASAPRRTVNPSLMNLQTTPVFGCPLRAEHGKPAPGDSACSQ